MASTKTSKTSQSKARTSDGPRNQIISLPNPHLRQPSRKVGLVTPEIVKVIEQMKAATLDWEDHRQHEVGVAMAAIQIDQPIRIVIIRSDFNNKEDRTFMVFINPEIVKLEGQVVEDYEGCLSVPDIYGQVPRYEKVRIKAVDEKGKTFRVSADGFLARVFQHEIDHTKGTVFIDHIKDKPDAFHRLNSEGKLEPVDYERDVKENRLLW